VKSSKVFVEVDGEEVQGSLSRGKGLLVVGNVLSKVVLGLGGQRADLLVASGITGDEEDRNAFDLKG